MAFYDASAAGPDGLWVDVVITVREVGSALSVVKSIVHLAGGGYLEERVRIYEGLEKTNAPPFSQFGFLLTAFSKFEKLVSFPYKAKLVPR